MESTQIVCSRNKMKKTANNSLQNSLLVFGKLFVLFYYFRFVLVGKTQLPSRNEFCKQTVICYFKGKIAVEITLTKIAFKNWKLEKIIVKKCWSKSLSWTSRFLIQNFLNGKFSSAKLNTCVWLDQINLSSRLLDFIQNF